MMHSLTLGSLLLTDSLPDADHDYKFDVLADGVGFGVAAGVKEVITSLLSDGDLTRTTRYGNREVSFVVEITGPDLASLAHGEAALRREIGRGNTLTWQPPDDFAVPTVFEVVDSEMAQRFDDLDELGKRRKFTLTLTASATRSANPVTIEALAPPSVSPVTETVSTADSTTGWTATQTTNPAGADVTAPLTVTDEGTYVRATVTGAYPGVSLSLSASATMSTTPYLLVEVSGSPSDGTLFGGVLGFTLTLGGVSAVAKPVLTRSLDGSRTLYMFDTAGEDFGGLGIGRRYFSSSATATIEVHDVSRTNVLPQVSAKQIARVIEVGGTERTPASIHVASANGTDDLTQVIVHTSPEDGSGYAPPLRRWRTDDSTGPVTADSSLYSGGREPITFDAGGFVAEVPTSALPEGGYSLVARVRNVSSWTDACRVYWSTSTIFPGGVTQEGYTNGSESFTLTDDEGWRIVPLAALSLPSVRTSAGKVQIVLQCLTDGPAIELDEAWLFREDDDCALSIVNTARSNLWLNSADTSSPVPTVWVGDDNVTRVHPGTGLLAQGAHVLLPAGTSIFTAALTDNPAADATFYRRWHSNAAE